MTVEVLKIILEGIGLTMFCVVLGWDVMFSYREWFSRERRADELLHVVLTRDQSCQLLQQGSIDIPSPRDPQRIYRVPQGSGLVRVIEQGRQTASLCLQPLERVPDADRMVMHKLMIEADEETYLQTANQLAPLCSAVWED